MSSPGNYHDVVQPAKEGALPMIEAEWLTCTDSSPMLQFVRGRTSKRKLRLFACAWCRYACPHLATPRQPTASAAERPTDRLKAAARDSLDASRHALAVAERYADGLATEDELRAAHRAAVDWAAAWCTYDLGLYYDAAAAAAAAGSAEGEDAFLLPAGPYLAGPTGEAYHAADRAQQAVLLRDIVGNPFRSTVVDPAWWQWGGGAVRKQAEEIYQQRRYGSLPGLARLLMGAGCTDVELLHHCRQRPNRWLGPWGLRWAAGVFTGHFPPRFRHVRGCWVLDLLTGRE